MVSPREITLAAILFLQILYYACGLQYLPASLPGLQAPGAENFVFWRPNHFSPVRLVSSPMCVNQIQPCVNLKFRTADGSCNNLIHPSWGMQGRPQIRLLPPRYHDGVKMPRIVGASGAKLPSPREVSTHIHTEDNLLTESLVLTHLFVAWGQYLTHDLVETPVTTGHGGAKLECCGAAAADGMHEDCFPIGIPPHDRHFKTPCMNFVRSQQFSPSATCQSAYREQGNIVTAFIDGSEVYGSTDAEQRSLRTGYGGLMATAAHDLPAENINGTCTKDNPGDYCFNSGDLRVNQQPMIASMHTFFHRFHNCIAKKLSHMNPHWNDERIFQEARKIVGAVLQYITFAEYLPILLGADVMKSHNLTLDPSHYSYQPFRDPTIINEFAGAAFRGSHSMINGRISYGPHKINLRNMYHRPSFVSYHGGQGLDLMLCGLLKDHAQSYDRYMSIDVTDQLLLTKEGESFDLASFNIQRGRDHGLPTYNDVREYCGLPRVHAHPGHGHFQPFLSVYNSMDDVDLFTGGLSEKPLPGAVVGPTFACILGQQFSNLKHGDRFWFQNMYHDGAFTPDQLHSILKVGLSTVLCSTSKLPSIQVNPFLQPSPENPMHPCESIPHIDLSAWKAI